jgi:hypothetical protein
LSINSSKTVLIPFTKKRVLKGLKETTLFGKTIQLSTEVKYLVLTLDMGLAWFGGGGGTVRQKLQIEPTKLSGPAKALSEKHGEKAVGGKLDVHHGGETYNRLCCHDLVA